MDVGTLKSRIKSGQLPSYLIFAGDEWKVQQIYIEQIAKVAQCSTKRIESISDVYAQLRNRSFVQKRVIYVVRDDKELMQNEKLQAQVEQLLGNSVLIHLLTTVDKRTKYYKQYKDAIIEFEPLGDAVLKKYIQREIALSDRYCQQLINVCEHDYGRILLEIDKIKRYVDYLGPAPTYDGVFQKLLQEGIIYQPPQDAIFDCIAAILCRDRVKVFELLQDCKKINESNMVLLTVLYNSIRAVLQMQTCTSSDVSKSTGLTGWQIKNARIGVGHYTNKELISVLKLICEVIENIKIGNIEEPLSFEYVLVNVL